MNKVFCPHCKAVVPRGNFCSLCKGKLVIVCDCWKTGGKYNCGLLSCPTVLNSKQSKPPTLSDIIAPRPIRQITKDHGDIAEELLQLLGNMNLTHDEVKTIFEYCGTLVDRSVFSGEIKK